LILNSPKGSSLRLGYEPLVRKHADLLAEVLLNPAVYQFIDGGLPASKQSLGDQFDRRSRGAPKEQPNMRWWNCAVVTLQDGRGIGRLEATLIDDRAEVAYLFGPSYWGRGYAYEAMVWLHERLAEDGVARMFWATVLPSNERSVRLLKRLGYQTVPEGWPPLGSYQEGDLVFSRSVG
jgi:RimJ/RimL family protein N-acetyltransferase